MHRSLTLYGLATAFGTLSSAHTIFTNLFINDVNQGDGTCVRMPKNSDTCTNPIASLSAADMACGRNGDVAVAFTCPAPAGGKLTFEFREYADFSQPGVIDVSHKGPMAVYLKPVTDFSSNPAGDGWFKIWDEGFDSKAGLFATEKLIKNDGLLSINLPSGLATGRYLVRTEIIALHNVTQTGKTSGPVFDPQFFVGCAQLAIQGGATGTLNIPAANRVSIPGHVSNKDSGLTFNIYDQPLKLPFTVPGPKVFFPCTESKSSIPKTFAPLNASEGGIPTNCLLKNANWCAVEVKSFTTEKGCWDASEDCYKQADVCYKSAPPTGDKNCDLWTKSKCDAIKSQCSAGKFTGPAKVDLKEVFCREIPASKIPAAANQGIVGTVVNITSSTTTVTVTSPGGGTGKEDFPLQPQVSAQSVSAGIVEIASPSQKACEEGSVSAAVAVASIGAGNVVVAPSASLEGTASLATASASLATATGGPVLAADSPATNSFGAASGGASFAGSRPSRTAAALNTLVTSGAERRVNLPVWLRRARR